MSGIRIALEQLAQRRVALNGYVKALHEDRTSLGISAFRAHGEVACRQHVPDLPFALPGMETVTPTQLAMWIDCVGRLKTVADVVLNQNSHPWRGCVMTQYSLQQQSEIQSRFTKLRADIRAAEMEGAILAPAVGLEVPSSITELRRLAQVLVYLSRNPVPPADWFTSATLAPVLESARAHALQAKEYHQRRQDLLATYREGVLGADTSELLAGLTNGALSTLGHPNSRSASEQSKAVELAREVASREHHNLERLLSDVAEALDSIISTAPTMALAAGLPTPLTLEDVSFSARVVSLLLQDPRPQKEWLNRSLLVSARSGAVEARNHANFSRIEGGKLRELYDDRLIEESPALAERFEQRYASFTRFLRPAYWQDMKRLKTLHKAHQKPSIDEAHALVALARQVHEHEAWLRENEAALNQVFGEHRIYTGRDTDWNALVATIEVTLALLDEFGSEPPAGFVRILLSGGAELVALRASHRTTASSLDTARAALQSLGNCIDPDRLVPSGTAVCIGRDSTRAWLDTLRCFWVAEAAVRALLRQPDPLSVAELIAGVQEAMWLKEMEECLRAERANLLRQFGHFFSDFDTNWDAVFDALVWTEDVKRLFEPNLPPATFVRRASGLDTMDAPAEEHREGFRNPLEEIDLGLQYVTTIFEPAVFMPANKVPVDAPPTSLVQWLDERLTNLIGLQEWLDFKQLRDECAGAGLTDFVAGLARFAPKPEQWRDVFLKRFYQLWLDEQYAKVPELAAFRGANHETIVEDFRRLDRDALRIAPQRVRHAVLSSRPPISGSGIKSSEPAILHHEINKRKRHKPIRRLFREIPNLLLTLKPCLMMSPLSVSSYLDAARIQFGLVIFDEASQVLPEDAVGAILRGKQIVVAGDNKQLPPTDFFKAHFDESEDDDDSEEGEILDSILDQTASLGLPSVMLQWHYRSRHEQLIAFSNRNFYRSKLITFPNSHENAPNRGVEFVPIPNGIYDRGGSRTNRVEARKVVDLVMEHAEQRPGESLGVVAFSRAQWLAIHQEWDARRSLRQDLEDFFKEDRDEPFFIKNLEEIQGDERDVIFFSMGYGKDRNGKMVSAFGPVNRIGGERRLNVAVTRARNHVKFVASVMPEEIDLSGSTSEGARLLVRYMEYALRGLSALTGAVTETGRDPETPFEEAVVDELQRHGLSVKAQIGCSGYRIDIGVLDDKNPGRFLLGIECDGATYHSSKTARDRDRLRQQLLEGLGWQIHRIWSQDWVKDPEREIRRVLEAVERARRMPPPHAAAISIASEKPALPQEPAKEVGLNQRGPVVCSKPQLKRALDQTELYREARLPAQHSSDSFYEDWTADGIIPRLVEDCVQVESPVHVDRVIGLVAHCWGFQRAGSRIAGVVSRGIARAEWHKKIIRRGDFLWRPDMAFPQIPVRRPGRGQKPRPIEEVALEELAKAALLVVEESFSLPLDDLVTETSRILSYERTGIHISTRIREAVSLLVQLQVVVDTDGMISLPSENHSAG